MSRDGMIARILAERLRQLNLPGTEFDLEKTPNDWIAIATHYLSENARRSGDAPNRDEFEENLIKAAAVILASLEHVGKMTERGHLNETTRTSE